MKKFWMVYRVGHGSPTKRHETPRDALSEARRLCLKEGTEFVVLEAMAIVRPAEPLAFRISPRSMQDQGDVTGPEREQVCQFIRDMYTGRYVERAGYFWTLPKWMREAIEADPIYHEEPE